MYLEEKEIELSTKTKIKLFAMAVGMIFMFLFALAFLIGCVLIVVWVVTNYPDIMICAGVAIVFLVFALINFTDLCRQEIADRYNERERLEQLRGE